MKGSEADVNGGDQPTFAYDYEANFDDPLDKNAWFARAIGTGKRVLEVGCATGYVGEHLANELGCRVVGVEAVPAAAEKASARRCYEDVIVGDVQQPMTIAPLAPRSFDFVLFGDVLEHLVSPERALQLTAPLLTNDGRVLICVPSIVHWSMRLRILRGRFDYTDTGTLDRTHLRFFSPQTAEDLVRSAGLVVTEVGGVVWLPGVAYRLPPSVRNRLASVCGRVAPNLFYGQVLIEAALPDHPA